MPKAISSITSRNDRAAVLADFRELAERHGAVWYRRVRDAAGVERLSAMPVAVLRFVVAYEADLLPDDMFYDDWIALQASD